MLVVHGGVRLIGVEAAVVADAITYSNLSCYLCF